MHERTGAHLRDLRLDGARRGIISGTAENTLEMATGIRVGVCIYPSFLVTNSVRPFPLFF